MVSGHRRFTGLLAGIAAFLVSVGALAAASLTVVGFNVSAKTSDPQPVARGVLGAQKGVDLWVLTQTNQSEIFLQTAREGTGAAFEKLFQMESGADRLLILYNADRLEVRESFNLGSMEVKVEDRTRTPLAARFRLKGTGEEFLVVAVDLTGVRKKLRHDVARALNDWARGRVLPVIVVGSLGLDWAVEGGETQHDAAYDLLTADGVLTWVRPEPLVPTQCASNLVQDFVFLAPGTAHWQAAGQVLFADDPKYCSAKGNSAFRPVAARLEVP